MLAEIRLASLPTSLEAVSLKKQTWELRVGQLGGRDIWTKLLARRSRPVVAAVAIVDCGVLSKHPSPKPAHPTSLTLCPSLLPSSCRSLTLFTFTFYFLLLPGLSRSRYLLLFALANHRNARQQIARTHAIRTGPYDSTNREQICRDS